MSMGWERYAGGLAGDVTRRDSPWARALAGTPRHVFVPRWWERDHAAGGRVACDGAADTRKWLATVYRDETLVTRVGSLHADQVAPGTVISSGASTSSSTLPSLVVAMYEHAMITDDCRTLVTTGTGYGTALACHRLGSDLVTSVDVDPYLVGAAAERLNLIGLNPTTALHDLTQGPLPDGEYDRIVSTVSVRPVPAAWLQALRPDGRLVTTITGTGLILVADKTSDGGARGRITYDPASFVEPHHGDDYTVPAALGTVWEAAEGEGEDVSTSRYPLMYVPDSWAVRSMLELQMPGIEHRSRRNEDGSHTVLMAHPDGSWARADSDDWPQSPTVHQGGPRRLWDALDSIRTRLNMVDELPAHGARVTITPEGTTTLSRGKWEMAV